MESRSVYLDWRGGARPAAAALLTEMTSFWEPEVKRRHRFKDTCDGLLADAVIKGDCDVASLGPWERAAMGPKRLPILSKRAANRLETALEAAHHSMPFIEPKLPGAPLDWSEHCRAVFEREKANKSGMLLRGAKDHFSRTVDHLKLEHLAYSDDEFRVYERRLWRPNLPILHIAASLARLLHWIRHDYDPNVTVLDICQDSDCVLLWLLGACNMQRIIRELWPKVIASTGQISIEFELPAA